MTDDLEDNQFMKFMKESGKEIVKVQEGFIWVNMLIRFTPGGDCTVIRSFSKPAKESMIKGLVKDKKKDFRAKIEREESSETEDLFQ